MVRWLFFALFFFSWSLYAQDRPAAQSRINIHAEKIPLSQVFGMIEKQSSFRFAYNSEVVAKYKSQSVHISEMALSEALPIILKETNLTFSLVENQIIIQEVIQPSLITVNGYVTDASTGETLPGAIVYFPGTKNGTYTNAYGFFSISQPISDSIDYSVFYTGYLSLSQRIGGKKHRSLSIVLKESKIQLDTIVILKKSEGDNLKNGPAGKTEVSLERIKATPSITGNGDVMNSLQMLPGVLTGLDGRTGFFIRGGNVDQNLVQLDEATIFNPNHLLGLVSVFNSSAVKSVTLLKGGFPASFGDHLSSVLDVTMKDGNSSSLGGELQMGNISGGLALSGPLLKDKASFLVSVRRSSLDLFLMPFQFSNYYSNYVFYDVNAKVNIKLSSRDRLYLSYYQGKDKSSYAKDSAKANPIDYAVDFGNQATTLRWNHLINRKLFSTVSLIYNNYYHSTDAVQGQYFAELYSGIRDMEGKIDLNFYPNPAHKIITGFSYQSQFLTPASVSNRLIYQESNHIQPGLISHQSSERMAFYGSDEMKIGERSLLNLGFRIPYFQGKGSHYLTFEPRLSYLFMISTTMSIKWSYTQMNQYLHLAQSFNASFPAEIWLGSSNLVKPQQSQQMSVGLFKNIHQSMFQLGVELYGKKLGNQLLFKGDITPAISTEMENSLIFGKGTCYGMEFSLNKSSGRWKGWMSYTLSYAYQQFDSLNLGKQFPFANDRRHNFNSMGSYSINKHWEVSALFSATSGSAFTLFQNLSGNTSWVYGNPLYYNNIAGNYTGTGNDGKHGGGTGGGKDDNPGGNVPANYSTAQVAQNNYRLAPYHRLDISITYRNASVFHQKNLESEWVLSVYNVYAHKNTYFAYCSIDPVSKKPLAVEVSFIPVIPSLTYHLKF